MKYYLKKNQYTEEISKLKLFLFISNLPTNFFFFILGLENNGANLRIEKDVTNKQQKHRLH